jgi:hypothetical protein
MKQLQNRMEMLPPLLPPMPPLLPPMPPLLPPMLLQMERLEQMQILLRQTQRPRLQPLLQQKPQQM